jgi:hypothetical protein
VCVVFDLLCVMVCVQVKEIVHESHNNDDNDDDDNNNNNNNNEEEEQAGEEENDGVQVSVDVVDLKLVMCSSIDKGSGNAAPAKKGKRANPPKAKV